MKLEKDKQILYQVKQDIEKNLTKDNEKNREYLLNQIKKADNCTNHQLKIKLYDLIGKYYHYDDGKFPSPIWLMYPTYSSHTMGWRMGCGENYRTNFYRALRNHKEFNKYFQPPKNWQFMNIGDLQSQMKKLNKLPYLGIPWTLEGKSEYNLTNLEKEYFNHDKMNIWDKISLLDELFVIKEDLIHKELEIHNDSNKFSSIAHAVLSSKAEYFHNHINLPRNYKALKDLHLTYSRKQEKEWDSVKYFVYLNAAYYSVMTNESFKEKLLKTGNKIIAYSPKNYDNEVLGVYFNGEESVGKNLFGFVLMELRKEIKRLYGHNDLIDWEYTSFIDKCDSYTFQPYHNKKDENKLNLTDQQSPEYKIYESTYANLKYLVRDVDLSPEIADKYVKGEILQEKGFTDASSKIGKITTSHRFLILSNHMKDLSSFEHDTDWGLYTAANDSKFKVLDVYNYCGKTQITLLHLLDLWEIFKDDETINEDVVESARENFRKSFNIEPVSSLLSDIWKDRCKLPIGLDDDGNYFKLDD